MKRKEKGRKKNRKQKKNIYLKILVIVLVILVIGLYFGYKGYNYLICRPDTFSNISYEEYMNNIKRHDDITVSAKNVDDNNYLVFRNVKIRNDFKDYEIEYCDDTGCIYRINDDEGKTISMFGVYINDTMINSLMKEATLTKEDKETFLKDAKISNDMELLDYLLKEHKVNNNIFTSVKRMKSNFLTDHYTRVNLMNSSYVTKIKGDYDGYIMGEQRVESINSSFKNVNSVIIFGDNKNYLFNFWIDDKFNEDYMKDIIETLVIEENDIDTFIRTYQVLEIRKIEGSNKSVLKLSQFQGEEEVEVKVFNSFLIDNRVETGKYYEFTFQRREEKIRDNVWSIFNGSNLIKIKEADKEGLEQIQEPIK